jgi:hypothetical protein
MRLFDLEESYLQDPTVENEQEYKAAKAAIELQARANNTVGLRLDVQIFMPRGAEHLIDVTVVSSTKKVLQKKSADWNKTQLEDMRSIQKKNSSHSPTFVYPPVLEGAEMDKSEKYAPLMGLIDRQVTRGSRSEKPSFHPFAISSTGVFGRGADMLTKMLVTEYSRTTSRRDGWKDRWGEDLSTRTSRFARRMAYAVTAAAVLGNAKMCQLAGTPWSKRVQGRPLVA